MISFLLRMGSGKASIILKAEACSRESLPSLTFQLPALPANVNYHFKVLQQLVIVTKQDQKSANGLRK